MKLQFSSTHLPERAILLTCSSHEDRCKGFISKMQDWRPIEAIIFHYDDANPKREENHSSMEKDLRSVSVQPIALQFTEKNAVKSLHDNMGQLRALLSRNPQAAIVFDISVFTKRHLLMTLRWLDDEGCWDRICIVYSEPDDYDVSQYIPLSFGLSSLQQIPGFAACPDLSRPLHLVLFLGYEGDRALAVYEHLQPIQTTLVVPYPPFKAAWVGRTEIFNAELIALAGDTPIEQMDSVDPENVHASLVKMFSGDRKRASHARAFCPLGTKPQTLGIYSYLRSCVDAPAIIYASPLRHNHDFFSHGIGNTWILKGIS